MGTSFLAADGRHRNQFILKHVVARGLHKKPGVRMYVYTMVEIEAIDEIPDHGILITIGGECCHQLTGDTIVEVYDGDAEEKESG